MSTTSSDPISDFLTRLRNAGRAGLPLVKLPHSKIKAEIARVLKEGGLHHRFLRREQRVRKQITVSTKFVNGKFAITGLKRVSKPGLRRYVAPATSRASWAAPASRSFRHRAASSPAAKRRRQNLGGELLALVY